MGRRAGIKCETVASGARKSLPAGLAGCRKFFDELNDLGRDLQLQAQKVEREAREGKIKRRKEDLNAHSLRNSCANGKVFAWKSSKIVPISIP